MHNMNNIFKKLLLFIGFVVIAPSCKLNSIESAPKNEAEESRLLAEANKEFEDLQLELDIGYVGEVRKSSPVDAFLSKEEMVELESEMKRSFLGKGDYLNFLKCAQRGFFLETKDSKECDYVVGGEETVFEFRFAALNENSFEPCLLIDAGCKIFQTLELKAKNNGLQRPPVFAFKRPVSDLMMVFTNGVFFSQGEGLGDFIKRFSEADEFAALVMTPQFYSKSFGKSLAEALGDCSQRYMNIIHFANQALKRREARKKPVVLTSTLANSVLLTGMVMIGGGSLLRLKGTIGLIKAGGAAGIKFLTKRQMAMTALDLVDDLSAIPYVLSEVGNWRDHINKYPKNSPQRKAIETALFLANFGDVAGLTHLGMIAQKHWKTASKVLMAIAGLGAGAFAASKTEQGEKLVNTLRHGNIDSIRNNLCEIQKGEGLRQHCSPIKNEVSICQ